MGEGARSIQIEEDLAFQRHQMRFERVGWAVLALVLLAALLGLFGGGPLGEATAGEDVDPIRVHYGRLERRSNPTTLTVELAPEATSEGQARVWIDRNWAERAVIESVEPEPESVEVAPDRLVYVFAVLPGDGPTELEFHLEYEGWGWREGEIGLDGGPSQEFDQFVYP